MRAVVVSEPGGVESLEVVDVPTPEPAPGEVLVRVTAAGVNRADLLQRRGHYDPPPGASSTLGLECSGDVVALGEGVTDLAVGEHVVALLSGGGYAEYVAVPAGQVAVAPAGIDLVDADKPLIWRGPMAHGAFKQLATQTEWGELDYLIVDLPPGTGDVPLTLSQLLPLSGAVIVCTPQQVAQDDARRAAKMFEQLGVPVIGVVENMSIFVDDTGREHDLFGKGGAEIMAQTMGLNFLGAIAIRTALRVNSDRGTPLANWNDARLGADLDAVARTVAQRVSMLSMLGQFKAPTISVH